MSLRPSQVRDCSCFVHIPRFLHTKPGDMYVGAEELISFTTRGGTRVESGRVMEIDLLAGLPIRVEYHTPTGDKRIERFRPDEFTEFNKENRQ